MEKEAQWVAVTLKTRDSPTKVVDEFEESLGNQGWNVNFKANWWGPAGYGVAILEACKGNKTKVLIVKWVTSSKENRILRVEGKSENDAKKEFYMIVDIVSDDFLYDTTLRNMMDRD
ncbi:hypothetical protein [Thermococcus sp.]|uniref:hypothetical protein n=1 Tax=Thermococcus sp. TaxID=35749 RepID=UPI00261D2BA0|nr:hypothetical protein [Thermococcus sp.]MCD6144197.1 hypothetical protein [Thermococcus sp.]